MSLYKEIVADVRQRIMSGDLGVGDNLPSVRAMATRWGCATGTVQRAYRELALQGLLTTQVGQGTRVASSGVSQTTLRRATLVNQVEAFLLEMMAAGYTPQETEEATREVLARWQARFAGSQYQTRRLLRFVGSHDPVISLIEGRFSELVPDYELSVTIVGSLGGLMALSRQGADVAGCHLWDADTDSYNEPFVRRLLPGRRVALLTVAHRRLGLIVPPGNPLNVQDLSNLLNPGVRFVNRQSGAGTRLWLETHLEQLAIDAAQIEGYEQEVRTHLQVAGAIAEGQANAGLGIEAAALAYGMEFVLLTTERYDLAMTEEVWELAAIQTLATWLESEAAQRAIAALGGYDVRETGRVRWVE